MKKLLLVIFCSLTSMLMGQISITVDPAIGCPNTTHNVEVSITNNQMAVNFAYTITINVKDNGGTILKTFNGSGSSFAMGETKVYTIVDVPFAGAMTCTVDGSVTITAFGTTIPIPAQNYTVAFPPTLTITGTTELSTTTSLGDYEVQYFLNGDYGTVVDESEDGIYTPTVTGDYTAKAVSNVESSTGDKSCVSAAASNVINVIVTSIEEAQNINISVYPNPVVSSVTISAATASELTYELSDMNGAVVRAASFNGTGNINTETLNAGTYVLVIKNQNAKVASYKLVK